MVKLDKEDLVITPVSTHLDDVSGRRLQRVFDKHVQQGRLVHAVDLRLLSTIDSPTLAALIRALRVVRYVGGSIAVIADQSHIRKVFSITGLDRIFPVYRNEHEVFAALETPRRIPA